jgi:molybdate transport system substrate-binding protein
MWTPEKNLSVVAVAIAVVVTIGGNAGLTFAGGATPPPAKVDGSITVSAAASLTKAFDALEANFDKANPKASVTINFGSSGVLEQQIESGAPVDVAAFADQATMQKLSKKHLLAAPARIFARNRLVIVTKPGNPMHIHRLGDLAHAGVVSLCADSAPCGVYADEILRKAKVTIPQTSITRGEDVKSTLAEVTQGDANAAIVYVTDAMAAGRAVHVVKIPLAQNTFAKYPIAAMGQSDNKRTADAFVSYVVGPHGQAVLRRDGFLAP